MCAVAIQTGGVAQNTDPLSLEKMFLISQQNIKAYFHSGRIIISCGVVKVWYGKTMVTRQRHFLHAGFFWFSVGSVMAFFGMQWVYHGFGVPDAFWGLGICILLGFVKGEFAIGKAARRAIDRIGTLPEKSRFYALFAPKAWALIFGMMGLGMLIRFSGLDKSSRGLILTTIGVALIWGSRYFWRAFFVKQ